MPVLYLMMGYPGAGKTTTAKMISEATGAVHLSSDQTRLELFRNPTFSQSEHDELYKCLDARTEELLQSGQSVIYDANLNRRKHRLEKYAICERTDTNPLLIWVQTPKNIARDRATHEGRFHLIPKNETPEQMFERIASIIEQPGPDEPYISIDGTQITKTYISNLLHVTRD